MHKRDKNMQVRISEKHQIYFHAINFNTVNMQGSVINGRLYAFLSMLITFLVRKNNVANINVSSDKKSVKKLLAKNMRLKNEVVSEERRRKISF